MNDGEGEDVANTSRANRNAKSKTYEDYVAAARSKYVKARKRAEDALAAGYTFEAGDLIAADDDTRAALEKLLGVLRAEKDWEAAIKGLEDASENIGKALQKANKIEANVLKREIDELSAQVNGAELQFIKMMLLGKKAAMLASLWDRYEVAVKATEQAHRPQAEKGWLQTIRSALSWGQPENQSEALVVDSVPDASLDPLGLFKEKNPSPAQGFGAFIKESINYEMRFHGNIEDGPRDYLKMVQTQSVGSLFQSLDDAQLAALKKMNENKKINELLTPTPKPTASDEEMAEFTDTLNDAIECTREIINYTDMLADPEYDAIAQKILNDRKLDGAYEGDLNRITYFQAMLVAWECAKLINAVESVDVEQEVNAKIIRLDMAVRRLNRDLVECYANTISLHGEMPRLVLPEQIREARLRNLAKGYEVVATEFQRMTGMVPNELSQMLSGIGNTLSGVGNSICDELGRKNLRVSLSEDESNEFIAALFMVEEASVDIEDADVDLPSRDDDSTQSIDDADPRYLTASDGLTDEDASSIYFSDDDDRSSQQGEVDESEVSRSVASEQSVPSEREIRKIAKLTEEVEAAQRRRARLIKEKNKAIKAFETAETSFLEQSKKVEKIKLAFEAGKYTKYLDWDLENIPKTAVNIARNAQSEAQAVVDVINQLEELSLSLGAATTVEHDDERTRYADKVVEYETQEAKLRNDGKTWLVAGIKESLCVEAVRKSNAGKTLLTQLADAVGAEGFGMVECETLPECRRARNRWGILATPKGEAPMRDHVVEFLVQLDGVPEFLVHFHFRSELRTSRPPDYYFQNKNVHDWNVQATQGHLEQNPGQETEAGFRYSRTDAGTRVFNVLMAAWKKTLDIKNEQQIVAGRGSPPGSRGGM